MGQGNKSPALVITLSTLDDLHINYNSLIIQIQNATFTILNEAFRKLKDSSDYFWGL